MDQHEKIRSQLLFFNIDPDNVDQYRFNLFSQIHQIVFWGKGGYSWSDIYDMPRWLRLFTFNELKKHYDDEKEQHSAANSKNTKNIVDENGKIQVKNLPVPSSQPKPKSKVKYS